MWKESIALKTLRHLVWGFDFTQLFSEISDIYSAPTLS